jgi:uncharacterized membrane protein YkoI
MTKLRTIAAVSLVLAALGWSPSASAQGGGCVADIRQVEGQNVMTLAEAMQRAGVSGNVVDAQLCRAGGGYVYRVRIRDAGGQLKSVEIPAG